MPTPGPAPGQPYPPHCLSGPSWLRFSSSVTDKPRLAPPTTTACRPPAASRRAGLASISPSAGSASAG
ncbi:protein of unknown function (plasmid) [Cupriavidus taiwanensis]|uniref:Uncharacterized protein n=1 Tax=Cupriavidus taiwanensis TaxID=164546 RepID=A0A7Z7JFA4_9BURK|nr:protein of unknown function [Cupriavidus taiwanensis]SOZ12112.1 protein of unknown function [Cupriavidus taiwanensis]SOZ43417.1 protein of unknown function [Cupriavidus taiwanensis]SPC22659.1 protein of unknown function [Cupriavidus taiwanensis]SPD54169.1 protein of unknown function [Cupriavidus taiwanensis]